ncbi:hypothetical protein Tco_1220467 [Tanacetum coccineum]
MLENKKISLLLKEYRSYKWYQSLKRIRDLKLEEKQKELDQALKERDDFKVKLEKWSNASVLQNEVLNKQRYVFDKSCIGFGIESSNSLESDISSGDDTLTDSAYENFKREKAYKAVPPPTGTIIPPRANVSFTGIDELAIRNKVVNQEKTKSSQSAIDRNKVIIEDWVDSDDEETDVSESQKETAFNSENSETSFENRSPNSQNSVGQESRTKGLGNKGGTARVTTVHYFCHDSTDGSNYRRMDIVEDLNLKLLTIFRGQSRRGSLRLCLSLTVDALEVGQETGQSCLISKRSKDDISNGTPFLIVSLFVSIVLYDAVDGGSRSTLDSILFEVVSVGSGQIEQSTSPHSRAAVARVCSRALQLISAAHSQVLLILKSLLLQYKCCVTPDLDKKSDGNEKLLLRRKKPLIYVTLKNQHNAAEVLVSISRQSKGILLPNSLEDESKMTLQKYRHWKRQMYEETFIPMDSEKEKGDVKERDAKRLDKERKAQ